jgi:peptide-methionine (S)-S-oxide reductase
MKSARWLCGLAVVGIVATVGCLVGDSTVTTNKTAIPAQEPKPMTTQSNPTSKTELATFGAGCFWCVEAVFQQLDGVIKVESGYSGGHIDNPTYRQVCDGVTGHAEVCQVTYDPAKIKFEELLEVFWKTHDPTTPNQQGYDVGTQYRSAVFFHDDRQRELAEKYKTELNAAGAFDAPIVTEISPFTKFYSAEGYHQNYFNQNSEDRYCRAIIRPKVDKVRKVFADKLKKADNAE